MLKLIALASLLALGVSGEATFREIPEGDVEILSAYTKNCTEYSMGCTKCCQVKTHFNKPDASCSNPGCNEQTPLGATCDTTQDCKTCCSLKWSQHNYADPSCYKPSCYPKLKYEAFTAYGAYGSRCDTTADCAACCQDKYNNFIFTDASCFKKDCHPGYQYTIQNGGAPGSQCITTANCVECCKNKFNNLKVIDTSCKQCMLA